ncbi:MAG TPA: glutamyl-tRNA reductase [Pirellulales bacterium]|jgi:glutamyl-tRNA reductase|nr:glutamyl-tRNA reductase [Pirellulales bacterium]
MKLQMVGCSHHNASLVVRERLAFNSDQVAVALQQWRNSYPAAEAVLLSTCNRVELYTAADDPASAPSDEQIKRFLAEFHGLPPQQVSDDLFEQSGEGAVQHLFTVAASLDSMVLGESQILAQVKQAYQLAAQQESVGPITHDVFQRALRVAKRVATETSINDKRLSIASVAVGGFARNMFEGFEDKHVLVIGAGETAEEVLIYLRDGHAKHITVINRHASAAAKLAEKYAGQAAPWEQLSAELVSADLIVSATGATQPIVTLEQFRGIESQRFQRPLLILDLAVPRDFEPAIGDCLGVYLYSLDDLQEVCRQNRAARDQELPRALRIVEEETALFMQELYHRATGPIIRQLRQGWHEVRDEELRRLFHKLPELDERSRQEISQTFERYVNKLLHPPLESLRDESRAGSPHGLLDALKRLFRLEE